MVLVQQNFTSLLDERRLFFSSAAMSLVGDSLILSTWLRQVSLSAAAGGSSLSSVRCRMSYLSVRHVSHSSVLTASDRWGCPLHFACPLRGARGTLHTDREHQLVPVSFGYRPHKPRSVQCVGQAVGAFVLQNRFALVAGGGQSGHRCFVINSWSLVVGAAGAVI